MAAVCKKDEKFISYSQVMKVDSASSYSAPLIIRPTYSRLLLGVLLLSHLLTGVVVILFIHSSIYLSLALLICILISFIYYYRQFISKQSRGSVFDAIHHKNSGWKVSLKGKNDISVLLNNSSYNSSWLTILNFTHATEGHFSLIVPYDSVSESMYRQLRVRLKIFHKNERVKK